MQGVEGGTASAGTEFYRVSATRLWCAVVLLYALLTLALPAQAQQVSEAERYTAQARTILEYWLADNTSDLAFRQGLESAKAEEALELLGKALALEPGKALAHGWSALAWQCLDRPDDAAESMRRAFEHGLAGAPWVNLAGDIEYTRGDLSAALEHYQRAAQQRSNLWHQWDLARTLNEVEHPQAEAAWDALTVDYPKEPMAWLERGWYLYENGDARTARMDYEQALELKPSAEAHNRLGILLAAEGAAAAAEQHYRAALALEPSPAIYANLVTLLRDDPARAADLEKVLAEQLAKFPEDARSLRANGERLYNSGSFAAALESWQRIPAAQRDAALLNSIGNAQFALEHYADAAGSYKASLARAYDPVVAGNLAGALKSGGRNTEARAVWEKYVALHGDDASLRLGYAHALFDNAQYDEALKQYDRAAELGADDPELQNQRGLALLKLNRPADAAVAFSAAVEQRADAVYFSNAGYAYGLAGDWRAAESAYRAGLAQNPADPDLAEGLAEALRAQGRQAEAAGALLDAAEQTVGPTEVVAAPAESVAVSPVEAEPEPEPELEPAKELPAEVGLEPALDPIPTDQSAEAAAEPIESDPEPEPVEPEPVAVKVEPADPSKEQKQSSGTAPAGNSSPEAAAQARLYAEAGRAAIEAGNLEQAQQAFQRAFDTQPQLDATADYALLLARLNRGEQLAQLMHAARTQLGAEPAGMLLDRLTRHWLEAGAHPTAAAFMERMIAEAPADPAAYNQLALVRSAQQEFEAALSAVKRGLNDAGDSYLGRYLEAYLTLAVSGPTAALPLARAVANDPKAERNAFVLYMRMLEQHGSYGEAIEVGERAVGKYPDHPALLGFYARALYFNGDASQVVALLEDPRHKGAAYPDRDEALGLAYLDLGNYVRATGHLSGAQRIKPENPELLAALGQAQFFMGEREQARGTLTRALQLDPQLPAAHLWHGWLLTLAGERDAAQQAFERVERSPLAAKEDHAWLALGRAQLALDSGDRAGAAALLNQAEAFGIYSDGFWAKLDELRAR